MMTDTPHNGSICASEGIVGNKEDKLCVISRLHACHLILFNTLHANVSLCASPTPWTVFFYSTVSTETALRVSFTVYKTKSPNARSGNQNLMPPHFRLASSESLPRWWRGRGSIWMHDWEVTAQEESCNGSAHPLPIPLPHKNPSALFSQELWGLQLSKYATVVNSLPARCYTVSGC